MREFGHIADRISRSLPLRLNLVLVAALSLLFWLILPATLFRDPCSTVVYDRQGELIGARIASDGQWRFPPVDTLPEKYRIALLTFEDQWFYYHPGVNPFSLFRAAGQNIRAGKIVRGGSTITMQVLRLSGKGKNRTLSRKLVEALLAVRLELSLSKDEILKLYASNAPFGGNVVGLEAASWRYFSVPPDELTWAESATLAVLPNAPALLHPGRNRDELLQKRNRLLTRLLETGRIDSLTWSLACTEPLPARPRELPNIVPQLCDRLMVSNRGQRVYTTIDAHLQRKVNEVASLHYRHLSVNQIHNLACLVLEVESGAVRAYVGNAPGDSSGLNANSVDVITSRRSTGSILKPLLFAGMLNDGMILPGSLVPDVPVRYNGYAPKNYNRGYDGAVPAKQALERSLNVPSVIMLKRFGVDPFIQLLGKTGFTSIGKPADYYGLSLILGGAEVSLWELTGVYASLARVLRHYTTTEGNYFAGDYHPPYFTGKDSRPDQNHSLEQGVLSAGAIWLTLESLIEVNRPDELSSWRLFSGGKDIAWKTGTSYGYRDAWAVGVTPGYAVGVWAGNADGEGRTGLTGLLSAAPLMFEVFDLLPSSGHFPRPTDDLVPLEVCRKSGYLASPECPETDTVWANPAGRKVKSCPYHRMIHLSGDGKERVNSACYPVAQMRNEPWFILPPLMEYYYKRKDPSYKSLPPVKTDCADDEVEEFEIVVPEWKSKLIIPRELDGSEGRLILEVAHRDPSAEIFWHLDEHYLGSTRQFHQLAVNCEPGEHRLTVVDNRGREKSVLFTVIRNASD
ncbi:MAG: penicillin-binding protein 1C [Bacteroidota bacterium]